MKQVIVGAIANIIKNNQEKIELEYNGNGGYEGWIQAELAYYLRKLGYVVEREVEYPSVRGLRCDLCVRANPNVFIEMKADTNAHGTSDDFINDHYKIAAYLPDGYHGYAVRVSKSSVTNLRGAEIYIVAPSTGEYALYNRREHGNVQNPYFVSIIQSK